jgi:hypothetical protein
MKQWKSLFESKEKLEEKSVSEQIVNQFLDFLVSNRNPSDIAHYISKQGDKIDNKNIADLFIKLGKELLKYSR